MLKIGLIVIALVAVSACQPEQAQLQNEEAVTAMVEGCSYLPRPENTRLPLHEASDDWFRVYEVAAGVYSIVEPFQFQETISHLILGEDKAILFDTGMGLLPIRPVVERITSLPVTVLNSHTHFDHVGGNAEFSSVLAIDSDYTRANMAGFDHSMMLEDLAPEAFCKGPPKGVDLATFHVRPWQASAYVADGEILDLGGRQLEVLHVPGHTPDSTALWDAEHGLLFTGDTFYDAELWLFVPETSLQDYAISLERLEKLDQQATYLLGAHNSARVDAGRLSAVQSAFAKLRAGTLEADEEDGARLIYRIDGIEFLTSRQALDGNQDGSAQDGNAPDSW